VRWACRIYASDKSLTIFAISCSHADNANMNQHIVILGIIVAVFAVAVAWAIKDYRRYNWRKDGVRVEGYLPPRGADCLAWSPGSPTADRTPDPAARAILARRMPSTPGASATMTSL
jgi:hypothetical protein